MVYVVLHYPCRPSSWRTSTWSCFRKDRSLSNSSLALCRSTRIISTFLKMPFFPSGTQFNRQSKLWRRNCYPITGYRCWCQECEAKPGHFSFRSREVSSKMKQLSLCILFGGRICLFSGIKLNEGMDGCHLGQLRITIHLSSHLYYKKRSISTAVLRSK